MTTSEIWITDDDASICWVIDKALNKQGYLTRTFERGETVLSALKFERPDLIVSDIHMPGIDGFDLLKQVNELSPNIPVIIMTAFGDLDSAVSSFKGGAYEYLTKPFDTDELVALVAKAVDISGSEIDPLPRTPSSPRFLGESSAMQQVFRILGRVANTSMGVLIRGESGSGKELVAKAIHENSGRSSQPLVAINTAAIPSELLESELFGHEKGAFTGAHARHIGRFEQANRATLFLDEIGDMPAGLQTRLLRVLSEGKFFRVGGREEVSVDVRIIAATNQDLEKMVAEGQFRNDLFHRLNVMSIDVPPLRQRVEDIPLLIQHFNEEYCIRESLESKRITSEAIEQLQAYEWPGNVRELQNMVHQLIVLSAGGTITASDLPSAITRHKTLLADADRPAEWQRQLETAVASKMRMGESALAKSYVEEVELILIQTALEQCAGHKQKAARLLGWGRNTLARKMQKFSKKT